MPQGDRDILKADTEDGYTKIANLLLEALAMAKLNGTQKGICMFLWRRTYGWGKSEDAISLKDYSEACGTSEPYVSRQINILLNKNVIIRVKYEPGKTPIYTFNTRVAQWDKGCLNVQELSNRIRQGLYDCIRVGLSDCEGVNHETALENPGVDGSLKKGRKKGKKIDIIFPPDSPEVVLSELLLKLIQKHLPNVKQPDIQKWAKNIDEMIRLDGRDPPEIKAVIEFTQADKFWKTVILSTANLRKHYDSLNAKRIEKQGGKAVDADDKFTRRYSGSRD